MTDQTDLTRRLRNQLAADTADVPDTLSSERSLTLGRRARRRRTATAAVGALAVAAVVGGTALAAWPDGADPAPRYDDSAPVAGAPQVAEGDFVPGTDIDETLAAAVAANIPQAGEADDIYPSDWNTDGPIPDARFANATDWQGYFPVGDNTLGVLMAKAIPGEPAPTSCDELPAPCEATTLPDGSTRLPFSQHTESGNTFFVLLTHPDGSVTQAFEKVAGPAEGAADRRVVTDAQLGALAEDPSLTFPDPAAPPAR